MTEWQLAFAPWAASAVLILCILARQWWLHFGRAKTSITQQLRVLAESPDRCWRTESEVSENETSAYPIVFVFTNDRWPADYFSTQRVIRDGTFMFYEQPSGVRFSRAEEMAMVKAVSEFEASCKSNPWERPSYATRIVRHERAIKQVVVYDQGVVFLSFQDDVVQQWPDTHRTWCPE